MQAGRALFVDTSYLLALLNTRDQWHRSAVQWEQVLAASRSPLVTTEFVLYEVADALASVRFRHSAVALIDELRTSGDVHTVSATSDLMDRALQLYRNRNDKDWGLTDCTSFVVMSQHGLTDALTSDDHYRQAGFRVLLGMAPETAG